MSFVLQILGPVSFAKNGAFELYYPMVLMAQVTNDYNPTVNNWCSILVYWNKEQNIWVVHSYAVDVGYRYSQVPSLSIHDPLKQEDKCNLRPITTKKDESKLDFIISRNFIKDVGIVDGLNYPKDIFKFIPAPKKLDAQKLKDILGQHSSSRWWGERLFEDSSPTIPINNGSISILDATNFDSFGNIVQGSDGQCNKNLTSCLDIKNYVPQIPDIPIFHKLMAIAFLGFLFLCMLFVLYLLKSAIMYVRGQAVNMDNIGYRFKVMLLLLFLVVGLGVVGGFIVISQLLAGIADVLK